MHSRNRHPGRYDFPRLVRTSPELAPFVAPNAYGDLSIDFADPRAVRALNRALLADYYGIRDWNLPAGYLCPPIPGRADYVHSMADLLADRAGAVPRGASVRVLDVGVGASAIYPIIGHGEYGWSFVGSDVDAGALASARQILVANPSLAGAVELRRQAAPEALFRGVVKPDERFAFAMCNPPFHASLAEAQAGSRHKWANLGRSGAAPRGGDRAPVLNFGGQGAELWCPGGEVAFIRRMIAESADLRGRIGWFSTLVSKEANLPTLHDALRRVRASDARTLELGQGQKKSRVLAWTFGPAA